MEVSPFSDVVTLLDRVWARAGGSAYDDAYVQHAPPNSISPEKRNEAWEKVTSQSHYFSSL